MPENCPHYEYGEATIHRMSNEEKNDLTKTESHSLGVSIFVDETHMRYKDIYTYLNELSEIFEDITAG